MGENQCEQVPTKHDWDDAGEGDDKNRVQMTNDERDEENDTQALTGGDITKYRSLVPRISCLAQDRPDLKFAAMQVCCAMVTRQRLTWNGSRGLEVLSWEAAIRVLVPLATEW